MVTRWIAIFGLAAALSACAHGPNPHITDADSQWNGGIWNSVLGYHGPANGTVAGGP